LKDHRQQLIYAFIVNDHALPLAATWGRLQTFLAVYDERSVRAAAEHLHVTAPAVSAAVGALENALGVRLFAKAGRGILPTDAAHTLADYARTLLGLLGETAAAVRDPERGLLRIGAVATAGEYVVPPLIASFTRAHPGVELSMSVLPRDQLFTRATHHGLDVVLAGRPPQGAGLRTRARRSNQLFVVGLPGTRSPLKQTWLLTGEGSGTRSSTLELLARAQADPPLLTLGTAGACLAAARTGIGVTLAHEAAVASDLERTRLAVLPVPGCPLERPWHLSTGTRETPVARLFVRHATDELLLGPEAFHTRTPPRG
jgi:DNA-binding transcriptional LysR family regulator